MEKAKKEKKEDEKEFIFWAHCSFVKKEKKKNSWKSSASLIAPSSNRSSDLPTLLRSTTCFMSVLQCVHSARLIV